LYNECHANPLNQAGKQQQQLANSNQKKTKAVVTRAPLLVRCAMIAGQAANQVAPQSQWHCPHWWKNKRKWQQPKNTIFGKIPLIRGWLLFNALTLPQQLQVESKVQKQFWMASQDEDAHHMPRFGARRAHLA
jgi:hypothetical protein